MHGSKNLSPDDIHRFITDDFLGAWNSIAANPDTIIGRGNFMFGRQAMSLLEFASMLCANDNTQKDLDDFSNVLNKIEPKYFTRLPSPCTSTRDFVLPHLGNTSGDLLLWSLFDLIRHGLAHQYQQILVNLRDDKNFFITLTGPEYGLFLNATTRSPRPSEHLGYYVNSDGDLGLMVYPDILFLDFEDAIVKSGLLNRGLTFKYLTRVAQKSCTQKKGKNIVYYNFDKASLESSLVKNRHAKV
jgi:hypothetical protein